MKGRLLPCVRIAALLAIASGYGQTASGPAAKGQAPGAPPAAPSAPPAATSDSSATLEVGDVSSVHQGEPVTDSEAAALAKTLERAIAAGDADAFNEQFDWDAFEELVLAGFPSDSSTARGLRTGISRGSRKASDRFVAQIFEQIQPEGSFTFLRVRNGPSGKSVLFRVKFGDGGLSYQEIYVARRTTSVRAVDIYAYYSGERLSETIHRLAIPTLPTVARTAFGGWNKANVSPADIENLATLTSAIRSDQGQQALDIYGSLPEELRQTKATKVLRVMAARQVDEAAYRAAIDDFKAAFPKDPGLHLLSIESAFLRKDFDAAHESITALDEAVGGDPYLMVMHANAFVAEGKLKLAQQIAQTQQQLDPRNLEIHWLLVSIALREKDHAAVARQLTRIRDELRVQLADLQALPDYAEFVKSPEYAEWSKTPSK